MQAVIKVLQGHIHVRRDTEHGLGLRRPNQGVMDQIHIPEAYIGVIDGQAQPRFADTNRRIRTRTVHDQPHRVRHEVDDLGIRRQRFAALVVVQHECAEQRGLRRPDRDRTANVQAVATGQVA